MSRYLVKLLFVTLFAVFVLSGCGNLSQRAFNDDALILLPPHEGPKQALLKHKLLLTRHNNTQTFIVLNRISADVFKVLVLLPTGQTILRMSYDGESFDVKNMANNELPAKEIFALMQFVLWPKSTLTKYYRHELGWVVADDKNSRQLTYNNTPYLIIKNNKKGFNINNIKDKYKAVVEELE